MKKPPIFTALCLLTLIGGFQALLAWQNESAATASEATDTAQDATIKEDEPEDAKAIELFTQARNRLFEHESVQADMNQVVALGGYTFRSTGTYIAASGLRYRLEYLVELGNLSGRFLEICDGQVLHIRRQINQPETAKGTPAPPQVELARRDVQTIRREAIGLKESHPDKDVSEAMRTAEIGIGGLPAVLASLERSLHFDGIRPDTIDDRDYLVVQGRWDESRRNDLITGLGPAAPQVQAFLPDLVRVYFLKETLFPEKFLYLKLTSAERQTYRPMIAIEYNNVRLNEPVDESQFIYIAPPGIEEKDETGTYLEAMRQSLTAPVESASPPASAAPETALNGKQ